MVEKYHEWCERRHASKIKPLLFLLVEFFLYVLINWIIFKVAPLWVMIITTVGLLYFFLTSSLKRYNKIKQRQKFYKE